MLLRVMASQDSKDSVSPNVSNDSDDNANETSAVLMNHLAEWWDKPEIRPFDMADAFNLIEFEDPESEISSLDESAVENVVYDLDPEVFEWKMSSPDPKRQCIICPHSLSHSKQHCFVTTTITSKEGKKSAEVEEVATTTEPTSISISDPPVAAESESESNPTSVPVLSTTASVPVTTSTSDPVPSTQSSTTDPVAKPASKPDPDPVGNKPDTSAKVQVSAQPLNQPLPNPSAVITPLPTVASLNVNQPTSTQGQQGPSGPSIVNTPSSSEPTSLSTPTKSQSKAGGVLTNFVKNGLASLKKKNNQQSSSTPTVKIAGVNKNVANPLPSTTPTTTPTNPSKVAAGPTIAKLPAKPQPNTTLVSTKAPTTSATVQTPPVSTSNSTLVSTPAGPAPTTVPASVPSQPTSTNQPTQPTITYISQSPLDNPLNSTACLLPFSTFQDLNDYFDLFMNQVDL